MMVFRSVKSLRMPLSLGLFLLLGILLVPSSVAGVKSTCGRKAAKTLTSKQDVRLYEVPIKGRRSGNVYGCLKAGGRPWLLGPHPSHGWPADFDRPFSIQSPWVAAVEVRGLGQDVAELLTTARNLRNGRTRKRCQIGGAGGSPGQLPGIKKAFLTPHGSVAWAAVIHLGKRGPQIGVCEESGTRIADEGPEVDLGSAVLHGSTLEWSHGSERRTLVLR